MERRKAFTPAAIEALKDGKHADPSVAGLSIEVRSAGKKVWQFRRRIAGDGAIVKMSPSSVSPPLRVMKLIAAPGAFD